MKFRAPIVILSFAAFAAMAALWIFGLRETYREIFHAWGIVTGFPRYIPFLDLHVVLAALQCHRMGFDVFTQNPCDALGRLHNYSPVWLAAAPTGLSTADTAWMGTLIGAAFLAAAASWIVKPETTGEMLIYLLALFSPCCALAIERGNVDMLLFIMILLGCWVFPRSRAGRIAAYAAMFMGALLKFYPIAAFGLALTEKKRWLIVTAALAAAGWAVFLFLAWDDLVEMWPNVPKAQPLQDAFASRNFFVALEHLAIRYRPGDARAIAAIGNGLYAAAILAVLLLSFRLGRRLSAAGIMPAAQDRLSALFLAGGFIVVAAFFAGQNAPYRGIWLLTLFPLLIALRRGASGQPLRPVWNGGIALVIFLLWFEFFHVAIFSLTGSHEAEDLLAFLVREPLWWLLVTGIMTLLWALLARTPIIGPMMSPEVGR